MVGESMIGRLAELSELVVSPGVVPSVRWYQLREAIPAMLWRVMDSEREMTVYLLTSKVVATGFTLDPTWCRLNRRVMRRRDVLLRLVDAFARESAAGRWVPR